MKEFVSRTVNRLTAFIVKGLIKHVYDGDEMQLVKVSTTANETIDEVERVQSYGLSTVPPKDSEALVLFLNGDKTNPVVVACDSAANRPTGLNENDVRMYSAHGQTLTMDNSGESYFDSGSDYVAMAAKVDLLWSTLWTVFNTWAPPAGPTIDNGAALKSAFLAAFPSPGPDSVASVNLRAD